MTQTLPLAQRGAGWLLQGLTRALSQPFDCLKAQPGRQGAFPSASDPAGLRVPSQNAEPFLCENYLSLKNVPFLLISSLELGKTHRTLGNVLSVDANREIKETWKGSLP